MLIVKPYGRLGNNISQLMKVISYSLSFAVPEKIDLRYLKQYQRELLKNCPDYLFNNNTVQIKGNFWDKNIDYSKFKKIIDILTSIINITMDDNIDVDKILVIHIRGGDSLTANCLNWKHVPYYVYKDVIDNSKYEKILIVSEDKRNPTVNKLLMSYSNSIFHSTSATNDFRILANARHLIDSESSYTSSAIVVNKHLKTLYTSDKLHSYTQDYSSVKVINYDLTDYFNLSFSTSKERDTYLLLDYNPH